MLRKFMLWYSNLPYKKAANILLAVCSIVGTVFSILSYYAPPSNPSVNGPQYPAVAQVETIPSGIVVGMRYEREKSINDEAELDIKQLSDEWSTSGKRYQVKGIALYGTDPQLHPGGPNLGDLDFVTPMDGKGKITYSEKFGQQTYKIQITVTRDGLDVKEESWPSRFGMGVTFAGRYHQAGSIKEVVHPVEK
jgi:hypothetical protein